MEDIRYQPSTTTPCNGTLFFAYGTFWHSIMSLSFIVIPICIYVPYPILPFSFLILSPQDGILVCGRKKAILDSYTSDSLWLGMWWHKIGIRGFVSPFFLLPFFVLNEALNPVIFILSSFAPWSTWYHVICGTFLLSTGPCKIQLFPCIPLHLTFAKVASFLVWPMIFSFIWWFHLISNKYGAFK